MSTRPRTPAPGTPAPGKITLPELARLKASGTSIVMVTAYDYPSGRIADDAGVDARAGRRLRRDDRARPLLDGARDDGRDAAC